MDADGNIIGYTGGAGLKVEDFPKTVDGLPALCKTIKEKTGTLCDIRLTVNDLLSQMVYEGDVKVISDDGKTFTFDSPEAVAWLQMYVDMVKDGTVDKTVLVTDQDRVGLDLFTSGQAAFYQTGPNLIRDVRANNPGSVRLSGCRAGAGRQVRRARQGFDGYLGERRHTLPQCVHRPGAVLHQPEEHARVLQDRSHLPLDAGLV